MADKKISELTNITGANLQDTDEFVVVDTSANETKAITYGELKKFTGDLTVDTATLHVDSATNRVGVGTSNPSATLDVANASGTAVIEINAANTAASQLRFGDTDDGDVGLVSYSHAINAFQVFTDAAERMRITNTGNVGIGTTSPSELLEVSGGDARINALTVGRGGSGNNTNTALGRLALDSNVSGTANTAIGNTALQNNTGTANTAVGAGAMVNNTASNNVALGASAMISNTTGTQNTALGRQALFSNTTANSNTAVGYQSLYSNTTGIGNTATGFGSLQSNTTGNNNVATGRNALLNNTTGAGNTAEGFGSLQSNTTGNNNVAVGIQSGDVITTGARNTIVGVACDPSAAGGNDQVVVGVSLTGKGDNTAFIGGTAGAYNEKNVTTWETTSDERIKKNITDNNDGLSVLSQIQVRNFEYRTPEEITDLPSHAAIKQEGVQLGVIAQEIQQVLPECVSENSTGVLSVNTDPLVWYLINAVKELKAEIETLKGN